MDIIYINLFYYKNKFNYWFKILCIIFINIFNINLKIIKNKVLHLNVFINILSNTGFKYDKN